LEGVDGSGTRRRPKKQDYAAAKMQKWEVGRWKSECGSGKVGETTKVGKCHEEARKTIGEDNYFVISSLFFKIY
jgi:hypothetical protein